MNIYQQNSEEESIIREILSEGIKSLGGYDSDIFLGEDKSKIFQNIQNCLRDDELNIEKVQEKCVNVDKINQVNVNEKSSVRDLNLAVLLTDPDCLGNVYFHRGNALMGAKRWVQAVQDYKLAIKHRMDGDYKAHHKMGQCYVKKKLYTQAVKQFKLALEKLEAAEKLSEKTRTDFTKIITDCIQKFSSKKDERTVAVAEFLPTQPSKVDPRITSMVEVIETIGKGRNAFAKTNIPVGSILAVVDGYGAHLNPDSKGQLMQTCLNCLIGVDVPYPCHTCARVVFCSEECQAQALGSYHKYQCQLGIHNIRLNDSKDGCTIFQSLDVIFSQPLSFWLDNKSKFLNESGDIEWPMPVDTDAQKMELLFQMAKNESDVSLSKLARHFMVTVFLLRSTRKTTYFKDSGIDTPTKGLSNEELVLGNLIYRLRLIQDMNSHPLWAVSATTKDDNISQDHIGGGMYTGIGSYFNSDCNPNTIRVNIGKKMLLIASKNIRKGEEVMDNYCIHFSELPRETRHPWIQEHFLFDCTCDACEQDWPVYKLLPQDRPSQKVADKLVGLEMENITAIENGNIDKALAALEKEIVLIQGGLSEPHQLSVKIRTAYQFCWWKKVITYLQKKKEML